MLKQADAAAGVPAYVPPGSKGSTAPTANKPVDTSPTISSAAKPATGILNKASKVAKGAGKTFGVGSGVLTAYDGLTNNDLDTSDRVAQTIGGVADTAAMFTPEAFAPVVAPYAAPVAIGGAALAKSIEYTGNQIAAVGNVENDLHNVGPVPKKTYQDNRTLTPEWMDYTKRLKQNTAADGSNAISYNTSRNINPFDIDWNPFSKKPATDTPFNPWGMPIENNHGLQAGTALSYDKLNGSSPIDPATGKPDPRLNKNYQAAATQNRFGLPQEGREKVNLSFDQAGDYSQHVKPYYDAVNTATQNAIKAGKSQKEIEAAGAKAGEDFMGGGLKGWSQAHKSQDAVTRYANDPNIGADVRKDLGIKDAGFFNRTYDKALALVGDKKAMGEEASRRIWENQKFQNPGKEADKQVAGKLGGGGIGGLLSNPWVIGGGLALAALPLLMKGWGGAWGGGQQPAQPAMPASPFASDWTKFRPMPGA